MKRIKTLLLSSALIAMAIMSKTVPLAQTVTESYHSASIRLQKTYGPTQSRIIYMRVAKGVKKGMKNKKPYIASVLEESYMSANEILPQLDKPGIKERHKILASKVMKAVMPDTCLDAPKNIYFMYNGTAKNRGLAGKKTIIMDGEMSDNEFVRVFTHELAHTMSLSDDIDCMGAITLGGSSDFFDGPDAIDVHAKAIEYFSISWLDNSVKKYGITNESFVSTYGATSPHEDFAEGFAMYQLHLETFEDMAKTNVHIRQKLAFFSENFSKKQSLAISKYSAKKKRVWDITKQDIQLTEELE